MGRIPDGLRKMIGHNIRNCRMEKYPQRGGSKQCAEDLSLFAGQHISPQQWSQWERGTRMPEEPRLKQIAEFFGKTVEWMRGDHTQPQNSDLLGESFTASDIEPESSASFPSHSEHANAYPGQPNEEVAPAESAAALFWLNRYFFDRVLTQGITVRLDQQSIDAICEKLKTALLDNHNPMKKA